MAGVLPRMIELRRPAGVGAVLEGGLPLASCVRLGAVLSSTEGALAARLALTRDSGGAIRLRGSVQGQVTLICQRCMAPMALPIDQTLDLIVVGSEAAARKLEDDTDFCVAEDEVLALWDLLEDEVLLALPIVPRHETPCRELPTADLPDEAVRRPSPFAGLADLVQQADADKNS